jgi:hypothetical protein
MVHQRRLKLINFTIGGESFECQIQSWTLDPGIEDGDRQYTYCSTPGANTFVEETDPDPTLDITAFSDWRSGGFSDYLWDHNGEEAAFQLDHHPDIVGEHVRWTGTLMIKPGPVGGEARTTEITEVTLQIVGEPVYSRIG